MNVGIVCHGTVGGSSTVAAELARHLGRAGHAVHVIARTQPARLDPCPPNVHFHGVPTVDLPVSGGSLPTLELASVIARVATDHRLDLAHVHYAVPHALSARIAQDLLGRSPGLPIVTTLHGTDVTTLGIDPAYQAITRLAIAQSTVVTAVSRSLAATATRLLHRTDIHVLPNFIDTAKFHPTNRPVDPHRPRTGRPPVLVHVSNFRPVKRVADCLHIFAGVVRRMPARMWMIGDGPDREAAEALARSLGVSSSVDFLGNRSGIEDLLPEADLLLLPSADESFGMAALEAMSCAVPVVASRVGGLPEVVVDGVSGRLLPVGDIAGMTAAALGMLEDRSIAQRMGREGRRIAQECFEASAIAPQYLQVYAMAIEAMERGGNR
jgi:N-acetyl-alpha-D-glucosaminyl L-malate synthase BshA